MAEATRVSESVDAKWFRNVLGRYPTGVSVITADDPDSGPTGMVVGSFTSISLDPPLVGFFPALSSTSWPRIARAGAFCVNVLGAGQEDVCRRFAYTGGDKFAGQRFSRGASGSPILDGVSAWIDCKITRVDEIGDHYMVVGQVLDMEFGTTRQPLVFFEGGYGRFTASTMTASDPHGVLSRSLRYVDLARGELEGLAAALHCRTIFSAHIDDELVTVAAAGDSADAAEVGTLVGQRIPHVPPTGTVFAAWAPEAEVQAWLRLVGSEAAWGRSRRALQTVRARGYSLGLVSVGQRAFAATMERVALDPSSADASDLLGIVQNLVYDPDELTTQTQAAVRSISAPIFDPDGEVVLALTAYSYPRPGAGIDSYITKVVSSASECTRRIGGRVPTPAR